ncbi:hypothetical protein EXIGLDRAFT_718417, partial [Exidia glandulosa HHB12029]
DYERGQTEPAAPQPKEYKLPPEELDTDFKKEFPPDPVIGSEMDEGARVWKVYRKEANAHDNALLDGWSSTLDILLIFAGLFSAVATAFVIESYQLLQPDSAAYAAAALYILVSATNHSTGIVLPPPSDLQYASSLSRWINGLWFTSILLSLIVALLSILVKQWIGEYRARNLASARSPHEWARRREIYAQALMAWPVAELVSLLPVMLHLSLFLFFAGVVAFLWSLDTAIGVWIIVLGTSLSVFYVGCTLVPLWIPECPTSTPLVHQMRRGIRFVWLIILQACVAALPYLSKAQARLDIVPRFLTRSRRSSMASGTRQVSPLLPLTLAPDSAPYKPTFHFRLQSAIGKHIIARRWGETFLYLERRAVALDASALSWIMFQASDSDAVAVAYQALGAIHPSSSLARRLRNEQSSFVHLGFPRAVAQCSLSDVIRASRSHACMTPGPDDNVDFNPLQSSLDPIYGEISTVLRQSRYPDALVLSRAPPEIEAGSVMPSSFESSVIHALRSSTFTLSTLLQYLNFCNPDRFSYADLEIVLHAFAGLHSGWCLLRIGLQNETSPSACPASLCLADLLAQVFTHLCDELDKQNAARIIYRLLDSKLGLGSEPLLMSPFLMNFLASHTPERNHLGDVLRCLGRSADVVLQPHSASAHTFWRVYRTTLAAARPEMLAIRQTPDDLRWTFRSIVNVARRSPAAASVVLSGILSPGTSAGDPSIWSIVRSVGLDYVGIALAETLASALCAYLASPTSTDAERSLYPELFLTELEPAIMVSALNAAQRVPPLLRLPVSDVSASAVHLIQHCLELRTTWWDDVLEQARHTASDDERQRVLTLNDEVSRLGLCTDCHLWKWGVSGFVFAPQA